MRRRSLRDGTIALCAFLLGAPITALAGDADTIARLAVWVDPARHAEFATAFDSLIAPRLSAHGLVPAGEAPPPAPDSVYSRLYRFGDMDAFQVALETVSADSLLLSNLGSLARQFGTGREHYFSSGDLWATFHPLRIDLPPSRRRSDLPDTVAALGPGQPYQMLVDEGHWRTFDAAGALQSGTVLDLLQDREGNIWFATWGGGVSRFDGTTWTTWTAADGLPSDVVTDLFEDSRGHLWMATGGTTEEFAPRGVARFDGEGHLWFSACGWANLNPDKGVSRFDGRAFTTYLPGTGCSATVPGTWIATAGDASAWPPTSA